MKKFLMLTLCAVMVLSLVACGGKGGSGNGDTMDLTEMVEKLYDGFKSDEMPMLMTQEVPAELFEGVFFIPAVDGAETVMSEPMMSSIAFSLVAVQVAEGEDAEAVAEAMKSGVDPRKWICVEANDLLVATSGDIALLVMLDSNSGLTAQSFVDAFNTVVAG